MKKMKFLLMTAFAMLSLTVFAHEKTDTVKVYGNCGMCKARIEKAAKLEGVKNAEWNEDTKMLTVTYNADRVKLEEIQKSIAAAGHDTGKFSADASVYKKLPGCCKYERKAIDQKADGAHTGHHP